MTRVRKSLIGLTVAAIVLAQCSPALAVTHGGEGLWGPTSYLGETNAMFIMIGLFVTMIIVFSLIQGWLDHRKHARMDAAKNRASSNEWKGGW